MKTTKATPTPKHKFEIALKRLEDIVHSMEAGNLSLEESLKAFQEGVSLVTKCQTTLNTAEQQVKVLIGDELKDFAPASNDNHNAEPDHEE